MKRKQRTSPSEQLLVDQTMEALDHCDPNTTKISSLQNENQRQTTALGNQLRNAAQVDLPPADPGLREMLMDELDSKSKLPKEKPLTGSSNSSVARWAIAAMVLLSTGIWVTLQFGNTNIKENSLALKYQTIHTNVPEDQQDAGVTRFENGEYNDAWNADHSSTRPDKTIRLPLVKTESESSVVSVPDGGTVLMGGVKTLTESSTERNQKYSLSEFQSSKSSGQLPESHKWSFDSMHGASAGGGGGGFGGGGGRVGPTNTGYGLSASNGVTYGAFGNSHRKSGEGQQGQAQTGEPQVNSRLGVYRGQITPADAGGSDWHGLTAPPEVVELVRRQRIQNGKKGFETAGFRSTGNEQYEQIRENQFVAAIGEAAISTFSIDVDTAAYANLRRFINSGQMPPAAAVRIEEMVNYFSYDYPQPKGNDPFSVNMELASCPWNPEHKLLRVGLKGKDVHRDERPLTNVVFLIDVSGSMTSADKLPLLKRGFQMMVDKLTENDRVSIVTYAGNAGVVLEPTSGDQKKKINEAIESLTPGGSTHGSAGIELAYKLAQKHFIRKGVNKVILATDGDLNVGVTSDDALVKLITEKASEGVFLTVLGFGTGNLKDAKMEKLADNGNGMYAYIDSIREAHKVLVDQMSGSLVTIAKDVKIQIEFNPAEVRGYRLIGYENRMLATEDFDNDRKDAGEIGAGHSVTALYELVTTDQNNAFTGSSKTELKYQNSNDQAPTKQQPVSKLTKAAKSGELLTLALRYKEPDANRSKRIEFTLKNDEKSFSSASSDFRFVASVASFGLLLRGSEFAGQSNPAMIEEIASAAIGEDTSGYRAEFVDLVRRAGELCR